MVEKRLGRVLVIFDSDIDGGWKGRSSSCGGNPTRLVFRDAREGRLVVVVVEVSTANLSMSLVINRSIMVTNIPLRGVNTSAAEGVCGS